MVRMIRASSPVFVLLALGACEKVTPAPATPEDAPPATSGSPAPAAKSPAAAPSPAAGATPAQLAALEHLICFGNEPFWAVQFKTDGSATCEAMCEGPPGLRVTNVSITPGGEPQGFDLLDAEGGLFLRGVMQKTGKCSDGMSDNVHPYSFSSTGKPGPYEGCCRDRRVKLPHG